MFATSKREERQQLAIPLYLQFFDTLTNDRTKRLKVTIKCSSVSRSTVFNYTTRKHKA